MKGFKIVIFFLFSISGFSQDVQTLVDSDFGIRDFIMHNDSITFLKKRNIYLTEPKTGTQHNYFIGGYGLKFYLDDESNTIISGSNELERNVSSVRFYDINKSSVTNTYYNKESRLLDFLVVPEKEFFVASLIENKIIFIDYSKKPMYTKIIEIKLNAFCRKLVYIKDSLYFVTDKGEFFSYNLTTNEQQLIHKDEELVTDFLIQEQDLIYSSLNGVIIRHNLLTRQEQKINLSDDFITHLALYNNNGLICGSWKGNIYKIEKHKFSIQISMPIHSGPVFKIIEQEKGVFLSSSLDTTIKKWQLN